MQRGRGNRDPFSDFPDPFTGFGGFGGFGDQGSLMSNFFGGRDPFDDPFFRRPFGGMFESSFFGPGVSPFPSMQPSGFLEQHAPQPNRPRGPIIEEILSDDEDDASHVEKKENSRKHGRSSNESYIEDPDEVEERKSKHLQQHRNESNIFIHGQPQPQSRNFSFQSSSVTYGGPSGAYYTSSTARRTGSDGLTIEESKEADTASRKATHRIARGIHNQGHSVTRKLNSDGKVDTMQTLHNLNEDELPVFEESWKGNVKNHLPGWHGSFDGRNTIGIGGSGGHAVDQGGWALPSTEGVQSMGRVMQDGANNAGPSRPKNAARMKGAIKNKGGYFQSERGRETK